MNMNNFKDKNFLYFYTQKQKETYQKYFSNSKNFDENFRKLLKKEFEYLGKTYTYKVFEIEYINKNEFYKVLYNKNYLYLVTCDLYNFSKQIVIKNSKI